MDHYVASVERSLLGAETIVRLQSLGVDCQI